MRKRRFILCCLAVLFLTAGCGETAEKQVEQTPVPVVQATPVPTPAPVEYTLDLCLGTEGYTIDPTYAADTDVSTYCLHLFEGLMKYMPVSGEEETQVVHTTVEPGMARKYQVSEDGLIYTFTLREAFWSDGQPVTAQDFVYSWQRLLSPEGPEQPAGHTLLNGIVKNAEAVSSGRLSVAQLGIRAVDEKTLEIQLEEPCPYFLKLCASPCLVPLRQDVIETYGGNWTDAANIVVNGAYTIAEWVHDDFLEMVQNETYYGREELGPARIIWHFSDGDQLTLEGFRAGDYDFIGTMPQGQIPALKEEGLCQTMELAGTYYLYFNTDVIGDWRIRAAMLLSVDREAITQALTGEEFPATGLVASGVRDSRDGDFSEGMSSEPTSAMYRWLQNWYPDYDLSTYDGRCQLAKALYQESLTAGSWYRSYEVTYCYNSSTINRTVAKLCQKNWADVLGLRVNLTVVDPEGYESVLKNGNFGLAYLSWFPDYDDPQNFLELMESSNEYNYGMWSSAAYDDLMAQIRGTGDSLERDELQYYAESQMFSMGGFPVCPVFFYGDSCGISPELSNVGYDPFGFYCFRYAKLKT